jgi:formylglycine-generating enzyme required for sulfatase activity
MTSLSAKNRSDYTVLLPNDISLEMVKVEGGTFMMGSEEREREKPIHEVKVPDFHIGKHPVTQEQWVAVMGDNPARFRGRAHPVEQVSWDDTQAFLKKLNQLTGEIFRLPSEAEWEYAARGGKQIRMDAARGGKNNRGLQYAGSNKLTEVGWYYKNSNGQTQPVGLKLPNELGLFDMSGNVWEWCADHWHENYESAPVDGSAWVTGGEKDRRVVRGGSWSYSGYDCRPSNRLRGSSVVRINSIGFRLARY